MKPRVTRLHRWNHGDTVWFAYDMEDRDGFLRGQLIGWFLTPHETMTDDGVCGFVGKTPFEALSRLKASV